MQQMVEVAKKSASSDATILMLGESGTGKSALARQIHRWSPRAKEPFVTVSCPSLSRDLLESELFGHMKGAFTGAVATTWGKVAAADRGTLFLDEIGELPLEIQPKLLRLLQEREYERVGESKIRMANVRVIAATNRNLKEAVARGSFGKTCCIASMLSHFIFRLCGNVQAIFFRLRRISSNNWPGNGTVGEGLYGSGAFAHGTLLMAG